MKDQNAYLRDEELFRNVDWLRERAARIRGQVLKPADVELRYKTLMDAAAALENGDEP